MTDEELLRSAGPYRVNRVTGEKGYNLAAVVLLGNDNVIRDICLAYEMNALVRKHFPDKIFLDGQTNQIE